MIVEPDFPDHWKTRMLVGLLGNDEAAPVYVLRLWAHCQNRKQWEFDLMPAEALKAICKFPGDSAQFLTSMQTAGYIVCDGPKIRAVNWETYNKTLISAWENGKRGGRPKTDRLTDRLTDREEERREEERGEEKKRGSTAAKPADSIDPELLDWLGWWNRLRSEGLVAAGVEMNHPSKGVLAGWSRVRNNAALRSMLQDRDAIEREIRASSFVRQSWFRLEKLFGGCNRDGEFIVAKLIEGGYRDGDRSTRGPNVRANDAATRVGPGPTSETRIRDL